MLDFRGNILGGRYFNQEEEPVIIKDGYASYKSKYDSNDNLIAEAYFGPDGLPILNNNGVAEILTKYNNFGDPLGNYIFRVG